MTSEHDLHRARLVFDYRVLQTMARSSPLIEVQAFADQHDLDTRHRPIDREHLADQAGDYLVRYTVKSLVGPGKYHDRFDAFVHEKEVLQRIADWVPQWGDAEIAGRLVGRVYRDDRGFWCVVTGAILAEFESGPVTVRTTDADAAFTVRALQEDHPAEDLVGWYHSHPDGLDEHSSVDRTNQRQWTKPYHLGLLAARHRQDVTMHVYRGPDSERLSSRYTARDDDRASAPEPQAHGLPVTAMTDAPHASKNGHRSDHRLRDALFVLAWAISLVVAMYLVLEVVDQRAEPVSNQLRRMDVAVERVRLESQLKTLQLEQQLDQIQQHQREFECSSAISMVHWVSKLLTSHTPSETADGAVSSVTSEEPVAEE